MHTNSTIRLAFCSAGKLLHPVMRQNTFGLPLLPGNCLSTMPEEVRIPMPWGHIAGKWWNREKKEPVVAIHGWPGNASTFDPLVPLLPNDLSVLALDLPGCGNSPQSVPGCYHHTFENVVLLKRLTTHFKWEKFSLIGHAMGGSIAFLYSSLFPETIKSLSIINPPMTPIPVDEGQFIEASGELIDKFLERDNSQKSSEQRVPLTDEKIQVISSALFNHEVSIETVNRLLRRNGNNDLGELNHIFYDEKMKLSGWNHEDILKMAEELKTHVQVILYDQAPFYMAKDDFFKSWEVIKRTALSASLHILEGSRHEFLENPASSSNILSEHLQKYHLEK